jgi:hypothetical protein
MTSFAHAPYPAQHPGVVRAEQAVQTFREVVADLQNPKGVLAALLQPLRLLARTCTNHWQHAALARRQARQDALMWEMAQQDPRLMSEIRRAQG